MTTTPTSIPEENLSEDGTVKDKQGFESATDVSTPPSESWVEINSSARTTPLPFIPVEEAYLRLLKEAQRENSNHSSAGVSLASSSHRASPKSPPNSPNIEELSLEDDLKGVYINYPNKEVEWLPEEGTDWIWDWSSRPDQIPPKDWKFRHPKKKAAGLLSIRTARVGKIGLFSREMMYTILITNMLSLILGTGVGVWLSSRRGASIPLD